MATSDTEKDRDECEKTERHSSDLYVRTGWTDANIALDQLEKVFNLLLKTFVFKYFYDI